MTVQTCTPTHHNIYTPRQVSHAHAHVHRTIQKGVCSLVECHHSPQQTPLPQIPPVIALLRPAQSEVEQFVLVAAVAAVVLPLEGEDSGSQPDELITG